MMQDFAQWLAATAVSHAIQRALWLIPLLQAIHILAIAMVLSAAAMIGLNILRTTRSQTMAATTHRFVPWLWGGLAVLAATGILLILGEPKRSLPNPAFQIKMVLLALAIAATLAFQVSFRRAPARWDGAPRVGARAATVFTLVLWCAIAFAGRWIAYLQAI